MFQEINQDQMDTNYAYILFYESRGLNYGKFMPDIRDREPDVADIDDEAESDLKKMCVVQ